MSEHYPKGFLFLYTNGRVCVADGQGGQVPVNIPELIAERDALRAEIERLKEAQGWIPVEERLPETRDPVLTLWVSGMQSVKQYDAQHGWNTGAQVTHWMPLPEPPKEVQG